MTGCVVEDLDEVVLRVSLHPGQLFALGAAMQRYGCETVAGLAEILLSKAVQAELVRASVLEDRSARR